MIQGEIPQEQEWVANRFTVERFEDEFSPELYNIRGALSRPMLTNFNGRNFSSCRILNLRTKQKNGVVGDGRNLSQKSMQIKVVHPHLDRRHTVFGQLII